MVCFQMTSWLVGTKHFPESKTLPRIQKHFPKSKSLPRIQNTSLESKNTFQNPKHFPESKNTSQNPKTLPRIQKHVPEEEVFWFLGRVFGFWEMLLDSGKCFVPTSHGNTIWPCWWPRTIVFTWVFRTKHSLNANSAEKKIVLCCVWRWGTPGRWGNLLRWGKKITPPLQAGLRF